MNWPQITIIVLLAASFTLNLVKHGEPAGEFSAWRSILVVGIWVGLLYAGGFWA